MVEDKNITSKNISVFETKIESVEDRIFVFDTTLRDGEQSAGVSFNVEEKIEIALQLEKLGVDIIEAGFPCTSVGDLKAVQAVSSKIKSTTICALARAVKKDIDIAWEGVSKAIDPRIHVFINSSEIQMAHQLGKAKEDVLRQAKEMVSHAAKYTSNIEFTPMDSTRSDNEFLYRIIEGAIQAGAKVINIADSVGYAIPEELSQLFQNIKNNVPNIDKVRLSFHGQNDLGLCSANTITAIQNGARQIEVTMNGIGERAGNTALEEVVMAIRTRKDFLKFYTNINIKEIYKTSKLVERFSGMPVQWNKAIVGKNAFRHGSGIHQDGILKLRETWEIMDPVSLGIPKGTQLVLGKLSGRHAFKAHLIEMGHKLNEDELENAFQKFKELSDKKVQIDERDIDSIIAIVGQNIDLITHPVWELDYLHVITGDKICPTATIHLINEKKEILKDAATGTGPIDAICNCINRITNLKPNLLEFNVNSVTEGVDAQGEVTIRIEKDKKIFVGRSSHIDILMASAQAYLYALNKMIISEKNLLNETKA